MSNDTAAPTASTSKLDAPAPISPSLIRTPSDHPVSPLPSRPTFKSTHSSAPDAVEYVHLYSTLQARWGKSKAALEEEFLRPKEGKSERVRKRSFDLKNETVLVERPAQRIREASPTAPVSNLSAPQQHLLALFSSTSSAAPLQSLPITTRRLSEPTQTASQDSPRLPSPPLVDLQLRRKLQVRSVSTPLEQASGSSTESCSGDLRFLAPLPTFNYAASLSPGLSSSASDATERSFSLPTPRDEETSVLRSGAVSPGGSKSKELLLEVVKSFEVVLAGRAEGWRRLGECQERSK